MRVWHALGTAIYWTLTAAQVALDAGSAARRLLRRAWRGQAPLPVSSREDTAEPIPLTLRSVPRPYHGDPPDDAA